MTPGRERMPNSYPEDWPRQAIALIEQAEEALADERAKVADLGCRLIARQDAMAAQAAAADKAWLSMKAERDAVLAALDAKE